MNTRQKLKAQQQQWATDHGLFLDRGGYVAQSEHNLFQRLHLDTQSEFGLGAGSEISTKMCAVHSSSALLCNVFDYWRSRDASVIGVACGVVGATGIRFESTHPTGLGGIPPHLDLEFIGGDRPSALESKFMEPYGRAKPVKAPYGRASVWDAVGMPAVGRLARRVLEGTVSFTSLDANQLFAHILGLSRSYRANFRLIYLWFDAGDARARQHAEEVERFREGLPPEVLFVPMTYQELFQTLDDQCSKHSAYWAYISERYAR